MIPYSRPKRSDLYTLSIPFTAAHTYIAHIWQYPPPPPGVDFSQFQRETEGNAYGNFWGDKQRALGYVMVFSGVVRDRPFALRGHMTLFL